MFLNPKETESTGTMCKGLESFSGKPRLLSGPRGIQQFPMAVYKLGDLKQPSYSSDGQKSEMGLTELAGLSSSGD